MTQFAVLTGPKPQIEGVDSVPLVDDCVFNYVADALTDREVAESWILRKANDEVIDTMCCEAQEYAQLVASFEGTELYEFLAGYLPVATAVTFFYATDSDNLPQFSDIDSFLHHVQESLAGTANQRMAVYGQYRPVT